MPTPMPTRRELANAIRALSMDAVQQANSGHPGAPMGMADIAEVLWRDFLKHNPANPRWWDRDRFVLSNGHASMLLYSLLHLTRLSAVASTSCATSASSAPHRRPSRARPGASGIETTTGPLGQGFANAVGMALAEKMLAAQFNRPGHDDRRPPHLGVPRRRLPDGRHLARGRSLAGTLGLGKLIALYDDNGISHRRQGARLVHRRHAGALRSLRLAA